MSKLYVVGIGPGNKENMTLRAREVLSRCDVIVGYGVYTDLLRGDFPDKEYFETPMTREIERCEKALALARGGKTVCMVCSGDGGVYGMAAPLYSLRGDLEEPEIEVVPGITAALSGGALLGAPLTHDFAVISLSDRLTPWEKLEKRLTLAAEADLSVVLYNPASKSRPLHLKKACAALLEKLPEDRLCGVARNIGREGEECSILTLGELESYPADMFCTVFIGNSRTKACGGKLVTPRGYENE